MMRTLNVACIILIVVSCLITTAIALYEKTYTLYEEFSKKAPEQLEYCLVRTNNSGALMFDAEGAFPPITILNGTNLKVLEKTKTWVKVSTESGRIGYITADNVEFVTILPKNTNREDEIAQGLFNSADYRR